MHEDRRQKGFEEKRLQLSFATSHQKFRVLLIAVVAVLSTSLMEAQSEACKFEVARVKAKQSPVIAESGFRAASTVQQEQHLERTHLWMQFAQVPVDARFVLFESVWGAGPTSLADMWEQALPIREDHVFVYSQWSGPQRDQPFTLGVRVRFVYADGSLSAPSLPIFITHAGRAATGEGTYADQVIMAICCLGLLTLWIAFRREKDATYRIRLAAAVGLVSLLFLSASPALPWVTTEDPSGRLAAVDCHLGDESQCATYVPDAGPNPVSVSGVSAERRFEVARWMGASSALRVGLILCLVLLMPALIWLLVTPTLRPAQTALALGASAAGYSFLAALFYRLSVPSWMTIESSRAFDLTMLTTANILLSAGMVMYWSFQQQQAIEETPHLPEARARITEA